MSGFADLDQRAVLNENLPFIVPFASVWGRTDGKREAGLTRRGEVLASDPAAAAVPTALPPDTAAAADSNEGRGNRAEVFSDRNADTEQPEERVGVPKALAVSCRRCGARLKIPFTGDGDMVRRAEAAGWHRMPVRHGHGRTWCAKCGPDAGSAV